MNDERKVAVYAGTRNLYEQMYVALKSLLFNTQMDMVYLFIEDDEFPFELPENVKPVNVSEQDYFLPGGPNFASNWSYMTMLRCVLGMMLPNETKVLWLDCDTIVDEDISDLFSLDINGYYYAAAMEPAKSKDVFRYVNAGVLLCNLQLLREMCKEHEMMAFLNVCKFNWVDQDCINLLCQGRIRVIGSEYNSNSFTVPVIRPKIVHFAAVPADEMKQNWLFKKYEVLEFGVKDNDKRAGKNP